MRKVGAARHLQAQGISFLKYAAAGCAASCLEGVSAAHRLQNLQALLPRVALGGLATHQPCSGDDASRTMAVESSASCAHVGRIAEALHRTRCRASAQGRNRPAWHRKAALSGRGHKAANQAARSAMSGSLLVLFGRKTHLQ